MLRGSDAKPELDEATAQGIVQVASTGSPDLEDRLEKVSRTFTVSPDRVEALLGLFEKQGKRSGVSAMLTVPAHAKQKKQEEASRDAVEMGMLIASIDLRKAAVLLNAVFGAEENFEAHGVSRHEGKIQLLASPDDLRRVRNNFTPPAGQVEDVTLNFLQKHPRK